MEFVELSRETVLELLWSVTQAAFHGKGQLYTMWWRPTSSGCEQWTSPVSHEAPHVLSPPHVTRRRIIFSVLSRTQSPGDNWRPGRNFSFKPRPLSTGWSLSLDSSGWRWPALSAYYLYFRYIVVSPWQWDQVTDGESGGGMRHNANTVTLRSHPAVPGPGARLFCETHSARASLLGGLSIIHCTETDNPSPALIFRQEMQEGGTYHS